MTGFEKETRTFGTKNPDIAMSPEPSLEPSEDLRGGAHARAPVDVSHLTDFELRFSPAPSTRCPPDFSPDPAVRRWAQEKYPDVDVDDVLDAMRDWEASRPITDWNAMLKRHIRREPEFRARGTGGAHTTTREQTVAQQYGSTPKELRTTQNGVNVAKEILAYGDERRRALLPSPDQYGRHV